MLKVFTYCNAKGHLGAYEIANVSESAGYYQGFLTDGGGIRTFRKDRVIEYHDSLDLAEAAIPADYVPPVTKKSISRATPKKTSVCFTGFKKDIKSELTLLAQTSNLTVVDNVSSKLAFLCCGFNAGPVKLHKARMAGTLILSEMQFRSMLDTGEIPEADTSFHYTAETAKDLSSETEESKPLAKTVRDSIEGDFVGLRSIPRRATLIALFADGFAAGWKFSIPESFREALDIKLTPTVYNESVFDSWTQGHAFSFARGTMIYSDSSAYSDWLGFINKPAAVALNIFSTSPAGFETRTQLYGEFTGNYIYSAMTQVELDQHRINVSRQSYDPGSVVFDVIHYKNGQASESQRVTLSQVEFVALLQHGFYWHLPESKNDKPSKVVLLS